MVCQKEGCGRNAEVKGTCRRCYRKQKYDLGGKEKAREYQNKRRAETLRIRKLTHPEEFEPKVCTNPDCGRTAEKTRTGMCKRCVRLAWLKLHPNKFPKYKAQWYAANIERETVRAHHYFICREKRPTYIGLPFADEWNPDKGGSFKIGGDWIVQNLGTRPSKTHHLHIVDRKLGFIPGNLRWVPRDKHQQEEMINKILLENQNLQLEVQKLREAL